MRWVSWLFSVHVTAAPLACRVEIVSSIARWIDGPCHGASIRSKENASWNSSAADVVHQQVRPPSGVRLGDGDDVAARVLTVVRVERPAPVPPHVVRRRPVHRVRVVPRRGGLGDPGRQRRHVRQAGRLADVGDGVDAEPVDATVEPEAQDVVEVGDDRRVGPVEIGLPRRERGEVPLAVGHTGSRPSRRTPPASCSAAARRARHARRGRRTADAPALPGRGDERVAEPAVLAAAVVRHDVGEQPQPMRMARARRGRRRRRACRTAGRRRRSRPRRSRGRAAARGRTASARPRRRRARRCTGCAR